MPSMFMHEVGGNSRARCEDVMCAAPRVVISSLTLRGESGLSAGLTRGQLPLLTPPDAGLDEPVDLAVEHRGRVACLELRAEILDHLVWVQDVGPHLVPPGTGNVAPKDIH